MPKVRHASIQWGTWSSGGYTLYNNIWADGTTYEIMLWMNKTGPVGPLGSFQTAATVGGHSWNVYSGSNGANQVFSFVRTGNTDAGTVDIRAVLNWIRSRGWYGDVTLSTIQFGYEITSASGGRDFVTNSYSASAG
ncbi:GH12 family glycosyl hydrolase domain-containing protein [Actinoplanes xinjiangensis]|uniref:GH12 family glycosyl hydrolase domain-containing protein n=1 Tax=Actinoplanes xinjiangensis TaxID=512350 RepID=UPI003437B530